MILIKPTINNICKVVLYLFLFIAIVYSFIAENDKNLTLFTLVFCIKRFIKLFGNLPVILSVIGKVEQNYGLCTLSSRMIKDNLRFYAKEFITLAH